MSRGLLKIELRRNVGLWFLPFMILLTWWVARDAIPSGLSLWPEASNAIRETVVFLGPLTAGLTAWEVHRSRWQAMDELLSTTPLPTAARHVALWVATVAWAIAAYATAGAIILGETSLSATWGGPSVSQIALGIFAVLAHAALGYLVGFYLPSRFIAPLIAIVLFIVQGVVAALQPPVQYLSPAAYISATPFFDFWPDLRLGHFLWFGGLTGIALAAVALRGSRTRGTWSALIVAVAAGVAGATVLLGEGVSQSNRQIVPFAPECSGEQIQICVHPAYRSLLPGVAAVGQEIVRPLVGLPAGPHRVEQGVTPGRLSNGRFGFEFYSMPPEGYEYIAETIALAVVRDSASNRDEGIPTDAQFAIAAWLVEQTGRDGSYLASSGENPEEVSAAVKRFAKLTSRQQQVWLRANYPALLTGEVFLQDVR